MSRLRARDCFASLAMTPKNVIARSGATKQSGGWLYCFVVLIWAAVTTALAVSSPARAQMQPTGPNELIPLANYIAQPGNDKDSVALSYVGCRCAALYAFSAGGIGKNVDPEWQATAKRLDAASERFYDKAVVLYMTGGRDDLSAAIKVVSERMIALGKIYGDRAEQARLSAGNMFNDATIASDWAVCKRIADAQ